MRFYTKNHAHYCGIDLHAKTMYLCILDSDGQIVLHKNMRSGPETFLAAIEPFRDDLVVAVECIFTWYWLADLCRQEGIEFVLGHALYMKAIHGGKAKNDKIDSLKIATLLRGGSLPKAYVYPPEMRATRDLLRRRQHLVRRRGSLLAHIQNTHHQYNLPTPTAKIAYKANRIGVAEVFADPDTRKSMEVDFLLTADYDAVIRDIENHVVSRAKQHDTQTYHRLKTVPGIGKILALTILYETHDIGRFPPSPGFPLLLPAGQVRSQFGRQEARHRRREDRKRSPQVGLLRSRRALPPLQPAGPEAASSPGRPTREEQGTFHPGRQARPGRLSHADQGARFRHGTLLGTQPLKERGWVNQPSNWSPVR